MARTLQTFSTQLATVATGATVAVPLDATGVRLRIPVTDNMNILEFGVTAVASTATGTALVIKLNGEPVAGGSAVVLSTLTGSTTITQGQRGVRRCDVEVKKSDYSFITVEVTTAGAASSTGIFHVKAAVGGSGAADSNEVVFTA
jgi:hypothetical protein